MTALLILIALTAVAATVARARRRRQHRDPHPIEHRSTIDYGDLRAMWPNDIGGYE